MILVDTSIWVEHFRSASPPLVELLETGTVLSHPFVLGELACGNLKNRRTILEHLQALPKAVEAEHHEVMALIERAHLCGKGIGWIDAHLLTSAVLTRCELWSFDKPVRVAMKSLGLTSPF